MSFAVNRGLVRAAVGACMTRSALGALGVAAAAGTIVPAPSGVLASVGVGIAGAQALPTDGRLVTGELDNGMTYIVRRHANPPGRAAMYLHVSTGSLNETDRQRGIAHYLEHMAFNGSENFAPGSVVPFFQSLGLSFGRHQNAFTSFDQTAYQLEMPDNKTETMEKAFAFFSDVAFRLSLLPAEIEEERQIIMEEKRTRLGAQQRVQEYLLERIAPGSIFGQRLPIGVEETIMGVQQQDFKDYYGKYYIPSNMAIMVIADKPEAEVVELIKKYFGAGQKAPRPADQDVGVKAQSEPRAIVVSDAELADADVSINRVEPPPPAVLTVPQLREQWVERLAQVAFGRRMERKINEGALKSLSIDASSTDLAGALRWSSVSAGGEPGKWKQMLTELGTELQRARLHGFTQKELDDARTQIISQGERAVQVEGTLPAAVLLRGMNSTVARGEPIMSPQQRLDLMNQLLPKIELKEVSWAFAKMFDPSAATFVVTLPTSAEVPSESELLSLGREAVSVEPAAETVAAMTKTMLESAPAAGNVVSATAHEASGVKSAVLSNNAVVHHRFMDYRKNDASIVITLAGGEIEETAENRGITQAASLVVRRPATARLSSNDITELMTGKKVSVGGGAGRDALTISVSGSPEELETGLQMVHALMLDGKIEQAAFDRWKTETLQGIEQRKKQPQGVVQEALANTIAPPGEVRLRPLEAENVNAISLDAAQAWFTRLARSAPMEIAVVGDIAEDRAMELVNTYLGSLPSREPITAATLDGLRNIKRPVGPLSTKVEIPTQTPLGFVINGFFGADQSNVRDTRLLQMASRIVSTRMIKVIREQEQLVYSIGAQSIPGADYPGYGLFFAAAPTEPGKTAALDARIGSMYAEFAKDGPTEEEMETARKQFANNFDEQMKEPGFWTGRLASMTYRDAKLDDVMSGPAAFQAFTAQEVKDAFAKYATAEGSMSIVIKPVEAKAEEAKPAETKPAAQ